MRCWFCFVINGKIVLALLLQECFIFGYWYLFLLIIFGFFRVHHVVMVMKFVATALLKVAALKNTTYQTLHTLCQDMKLEFCIFFAEDTVQHHWGKDYLKNLLPKFHTWWHSLYRNYETRNQNTEAQKQTVNFFAVFYLLSFRSVTKALFLLFYNIQRGLPIHRMAWVLEYNQ